MKVTSAQVSMVRKTTPRQTSTPLSARDLSASRSGRLHAWGQRILVARAAVLQDAQTVDCNGPTPDLFATRRGQEHKDPLKSNHCRNFLCFVPKKSASWRSARICAELLPEFSVNGQSSLKPTRRLHNLIGPNIHTVRISQVLQERVPAPRFHQLFPAGRSSWLSSSTAACA